MPQRKNNAGRRLGGVSAADLGIELRVEEVVVVVQLAEGVAGEQRVSCGTFGGDARWVVSGVL